MTDNKFTDEEVVKALECCTSSTTSEACNGCPFSETDICEKMSNALEIYALDLINRQKAEIEELNTNLALAFDNAKNNTIERIREHTIRFVAIKEFAERLKRTAFLPLGTYIAEHIITDSQIDNLVKEMTEEKTDEKIH